MQNQNLVEVVRRARLLACMLTMFQSGCATMPTTGPTVGQIEKAAKSQANTISYEIVNITPDLIAAKVPNGNDEMMMLSALGASKAPERSDIIRPGDTLAITIYEVGVSLFGGVANIGVAQSALASPVANGQRISMAVDDDGEFSLPYVGTIQAAGRTPAAVSRELKARLRPMSQSPEVLVAINDSVMNTVYLSGEARKAGRYRLTAAKERVLDLIALGGGSEAEPFDTIVRVTRNERTASILLTDLHAEDLGNIVLAPGDRIELTRSPRTYSVFGATDKVAQTPFAAPAVSLAEAIARATGPSDLRSNPRGIFLFRFEKSSEQIKPIIYRLNLMDPQNYFLAQHFAMRDKDVVYFANSASNPPAKLIGLINQIVSPAVTAKVLSQ